MAVKAGRVTVGPTPTLLSVLEGDTFPGQSLAFVAMSGAIDVGGSDVATGAGWPATAGVPQAVDLQPGEGLYAVTPSGSIVVAVLHTGA
jgi:hypothetical protein